MKQEQNIDNFSGEIEKTLEDSTQEIIETSLEVENNLREEIDGSIQEFNQLDENPIQIEKEIVLDDPSSIAEVKKEINFDENVKHLNNEAQNLREETLNKINNTVSKEAELSVENNGDGVGYIFEQNPELLTMGTREQYSQYIENIFPESKIKDIVYHYTSTEKDKIYEEGMKPSSETGKVTGAGDIDAIFATISPDNYWGEGFNKIPLLVNIKNPIDLSHLNPEDKEENLSTEDLQTLKEYKNIISVGTDNASDRKEVPIMVKNEFIKRGYDSTLSPGLKEIAVFNKSDVHVLGGTEDMQNFKKWLEQNKANT